MQYTVTSRGRPIGVTDLGFVRIGGPSRSGWFHPNAEGERLMPVIAAVLPAMRAYLHANVCDGDGRPLVQPELLGSALFADVAEAFHHADALDLAIRREDGSLVPTQTVGIQDTHQLLELADLAEARDDNSLMSDDMLGESIWDAPEFDSDDDSMMLDDTDDLFGEWTPDSEAPTFPRYQIHVVLIDDDAIP